MAPDRDCPLKENAGKNPSIKDCIEVIYTWDWNRDSCPCTVPPPTIITTIDTLQVGAVDVVPNDEIEFRFLIQETNRNCYAVTRMNQKGEAKTYLIGKINNPSLAVPILNAEAIQILNKQFQQLRLLEQFSPASSQHRSAKKRLQKLQRKPLTIKF